MVSFILAACADAAFDNCNSCGDVDSDSQVAECLSCGSGYLLKDDASECLDLSSLDCPGTYVKGADDELVLVPGYEDRGAECTSCASNYVTTADKAVCTQYCYVCGDITAGTFVDAAQCKSSGNTSVTERCDTGSCWVSGF